MSISNAIARLQALPVQQIVEQYGTPLYLYDGDKIIDQYKRLNDSFSGVKLKVKYALKACNNINVLRLLLKQGSGLDAVSIRRCSWD